MIKKLLAAVLAAVLTAAMFIIPAAADFSNAKSLESGKKATEKLGKNGDYVDYKIKVAKSGALSVKMNSYMSYLDVFVAGCDEMPIKNDRVIIQSAWFSHKNIEFFNFTL